MADILRPWYSNFHDLLDIGIPVFNAYRDLVGAGPPAGSEPEVFAPVTGTPPMESQEYDVPSTIHPASQVVTRSTPDADSEPLKMVTNRRTTRTKIPTWLTPGRSSHPPRRRR